MSTSTEQISPAPVPPPPRQKHGRGFVISGLGLGGFVLLGIGFAAGQAAKATTTGSGAIPAVTKTVTVQTPGQTTTDTVTVTVTPSPPAPAGPATSIPDGANGVYVVGQDIKAGTWHTAGASANDFTPDCYYALLASTNTNNIIDNNNVTGPATVTIGSGVVAFDTSGCAGWTLES